MKNRYIWLFLIFFLLYPFDVYCWIAALSDYSFVPRDVLAIDKTRQKVFVIEVKSPLSQKMIFPCTTGENRGDKWKEGDRKTPEGVYFVEGEISKGIDPDKYGSLAFTLNYPNPVDVLKGKKGYGIWIHGRGYSVTNYRTKGCVALSYHDIRRLKKVIEIGKTPVVIAERIIWKNSGNIEKEAKEIISKVYKWAKAWSFRDSSYFEFYDSHFYSKDTGSFFSFKRRKKRLFKRYRWIDLAVFEPKVVFGPDYAVSFFYQAYVCPGFSSFGIKRLYWKKGELGWKIVGNEWRNIEGSYVKDIYLKIKIRSILKWLEEWRRAWVMGDLERYISFYSKNSVQDGLKGRKNILEFKKRLWKKDPPRTIKFLNPKVNLTPAGFVVSFIQFYESKNGYKDVGKKKLVLIPYRNTWLIEFEKWQKLRLR